MVKSELKMSVSRHVCRHAKKKILQELMGSYKEEYATLDDYAQAVMATNLGSTCFFKSSTKNPEGQPLFIRFYICLDACKRGWVGSYRKLIGLDGCFLKGFVKDNCYVLWGGMETTKCF